MSKPGLAVTAFILAATLTIGVASPSSAFQGDCGQPISTGSSPVATDALFVLRVAVGTAQCDNCVCDLDDSGAVTATDALTDLKAATGQPVSLSCPPCSCFDSEVPTCGGPCADESEVCAPDPFGGDECECLSACEASDAPTCGGSCESEGDPSLQCLPLTYGNGTEMIDVCTCLPPDVVGCGEADAPECFGACHPGAVCVDMAGTCGCFTLPQQGSCASAEAPACGGTCDGNNICMPNGVDGCACAPYVGMDTCEGTAETPMCGAGACPFSEVCSVGFLGDCECFEPCEIGDAPACNGACEAGEQCVARTVSVNGSTVDFCECEFSTP